MNEPFYNEPSSNKLCSNEPSSNKLCSNELCGNEPCSNKPSRQKPNIDDVPSGEETSDDGGELQRGIVFDIQESNSSTEELAQDNVVLNAICDNSRKRKFPLSFNTDTEDSLQHPDSKRAKCDESNLGKNAVLYRLSRTFKSDI